MASEARTPQDFYNNAAICEWRQILQCYNNVLQKKASTKSKESAAKELIELDKWYHNELPKIVEKREPKCLRHEELVQIMKWKLLRGKFRPNLMNLIKSNTLRSVEVVTKAAFRKLPDVNKALDHLSGLKGIGPATASGILAALNPDVPFMADEAMLCIPGLEDLEYTRGEFIFYKEKVQECLARLRKEDAEFGWTAHKVDMALWTYYIGCQLDESLIESVIKLQQNQPAESTPATKESESEFDNSEEAAKDDSEEEEQPASTENGTAHEETGTEDTGTPKLANGFSEDCSSSSDKENQVVTETKCVENGVTGEESSQSEMEPSEGAATKDVTSDSKKRKLEDAVCTDVLDDYVAKKTKL